MSIATQQLLPPVSSPAPTVAPAIEEAIDYPVVIPSQEQPDLPPLEAVPPVPKTSRVGNWLRTRRDNFQAHRAARRLRREYDSHCANFVGHPEMQHELDSFWSRVND